MPRITTKPADITEPAPIEIMEQAVIDLAEGMKALSRSRISIDAVVTLLHHKTGVTRKDIRLVLDNLSDLEALFLKPKR
jgi:hypothetical protein